MYKKNKNTNKNKSKELFQNLKGNFSCFGTYDLKNTLKVFYQTEKGAVGMINFPNPVESEIEAAFKNSKISGFGKGDKNVVDQTYRKACQIPEDGLGFSSIYEQILQTICSDISKLMAKNGSRVKAELIKLNIYGPGGFFKSHVDSPKGQAFGSLVVFLPNTFQGGVLKIEHENHPQDYNFGGKEHSKEINWVAFYNDCVHQITQVKSGYRLTLSYNLILQQTGDIISAKPDSNIVERLLTLEPKTKYIFYCEHYYGNNVLKYAETNPLKILKGKDAQIWLGAKFVQFQISLKILIQMQRYAQQGGRISELFLGRPQKIAQIRAGEVQNSEYGQEDDIKNRNIQAFGLIQIDNDSKLQYLNKQKNDTSKYIYSIGGYYGNDYSINQKYCELILYISVPE